MWAYTGARSKAARFQKNAESFGARFGRENVA
jgi:hypothetical protein